MKVSVIIVNFNGKHHLQDCVSSLQSQSLTDLEIIIVDNNSSDGSQEFVEKNFPHVRLIALGENTGFTGGNNVGIKHAKGDYVLLLNNDTAIDQFCVEKMAKALGESSTDTIGVFPKVLFFDEPSSINSYSVVWNHKMQWRDNYCGLIDVGQFKAREVIFGAMFVAVLFKKNDFEQIGLFDETFWTYGEDFDVAYRANVLGYQFLIEPEAKVYHKFRSSSRDDRDPLWAYRFFLRNYIFVFLKNVEALNLVRYFFYFSRFIRGAFFRGVKNFRNSRDPKLIKLVLKVVGEVIGSLPVILRERRWIQKNRVKKDYEFWNFESIEENNIFHYESAIVLNKLALRKAMHGPQNYQKDGKSHTTL